jgi:PleD family two-component response regulator
VLCEKLRALVAQPTFEKIRIQVTISLGVVQVGRGISTAVSAIAAADRALYGAKRSGLIGRICISRTLAGPADAANTAERLR